MNKIKKLVAVAISAVMITSVFVGCNKKSSEATINFLNQGDYIDEDLLKKFEKETGIKVNYESFDTNEQMYQKLKSGANSYDLVIPSDYMIQRMISEDMLEKLDYNNITNIKNIDSKFNKLPHDKNDEYTAPYMWGTVGILYDSEKVKEPVTDWDILWDPKYENQIIMYDSMRESMGIALQKLGYSLNSTKDEEIKKAEEELIKQKPLVRAYMIDEMKERMAAGEAALAVAWSGDAVLIQEKNPNIKYAIPKHSNIWIDAMCIPKGAPHKEEAEKLINFLLEGENAKQNSEYIGYSTTNKAAFDLLDKEMQEDKVAYPDEESLKELEYYSYLKEDIKKYEEAWIKVKSE